MRDRLRNVARERVFVPLPPTKTVHKQGHYREGDGIVVTHLTGNDDMYPDCVTRRTLEYDVPLECEVDVVKEIAALLEGHGVMCARETNYYLQDGKEPTVYRTETIDYEYDGDEPPVQPSDDRQIWPYNR